MNAWRKELRTMLDRLATARPAVLRRSREEDFLYATDLPQIATEAQILAFGREAESCGWRWIAENGWIQLSHPAEMPPEGWFEGPFGPEAACCASLLERHGADGNRTAETETQRAAIALIKAGEEGPAAYEQTCQELHRKLAERLRNGESLPAPDLRFFRG